MEAQAERDRIEERRKALIIAISDYINLPKLEFCQKDGEEVAKVLTTLNYEIPESGRLIGNIKSDSMKDAIYGLFFRIPQSKVKDTLLFYYSGHGVPDIDGDVYLASCELDPDSPFRKGFSFNELTKMMHRSISTRIVAILDCCYSGAARVSKGSDDAEATIGTTTVHEQSKILQGEGKSILAASQATQEAYKLLESDHSVFTYYLLKGFKGDQDSVDVYGNVTPDTLGRYVYSEIVNLPAEKRPKQKPITKTEVAGDIVLAHYPELARPGAEPRDQVSIMIEEANNYFSTGKYDAAVDCYNRVLKLDPENFIAWNGKGRVLTELEKYDEAIECYDRSIKFNPNNSSAYRGKAEVYRKKIKMWKFIVLTFLGISAISLGISFLIPFPYSFPVIVVAIIVWARSFYNYMNRNSRKSLQEAKKLESYTGTQAKKDSRYNFLKGIRLRLSRPP